MTPLIAYVDMEKTAERNRDFVKIMKGTAKQLSESPALGHHASTSSALSSSSSPGSSPGLHSHNSTPDSRSIQNLASTYRYLFFFGDLNYRVEADRDWVVSKVENRDFESLICALTIVALLSLSIS